MENCEEGEGPAPKRTRWNCDMFDADAGTSRSSDSGEWSPDSSTNPMMNVVVLTKFFEVCDLSDLARFRLVNEQWYDLSLRRWRAEMPLRIGDFEVGNGVRRPPRRRAKGCHRGRLDWTDVSKLYDDEEWTKLDENPFRIYRLSNVTFGNPGRRNSSFIATRTRSRIRNNCDTVDMDSFWERCGPSMRHLNLDEPRITSVDSLTKVLFENTPNLESLRLVDFKMEANDMSEADDKLSGDVVRAVQPNLKSLVIGSSERKGLPIKWKHLFRFFPNLEELGAHYLGTEDMISLAEALEELIVQKNRKMNFKSLQFWYCLCEPELAKRVLGLTSVVNLESLKLSLWEFEDESGSLLTTALELHGHSLKKLVISEGCPFIDVFRYDTFPLHFTSLSELCLVGKVFPNLHFLMETPNLKVFRFRPFVRELKEMFRQTDEFFEDTTVLPHLVEFEVSNSFLDDSVRITGSMMRRIVQLMPNVKTLKAPLSLGAVQMACENWKELVSLNTLNSELNDYVIAGSVNGHENSFPNMTNLKYLQVLSIGQSRNVGNDSVFNGFLKMPNLHTLNVNMKSRIGFRAIKALNNRFPGSKYRPEVKDYGTGD